MIAELLKRRETRRKVKDQRAFLRETERMMKRAKFLEGNAKRQLEEAQSKLRAALDQANENTAGVSADNAVKQLDDLAQKHLAIYKKSSAREYFESVGFAILVALTLRAFVIEAFKIPSGSMIPTLEIGDQIFVNKYVYGLRVPFTLTKFAQLNEPKRGEVIVFIYPVDESRDYIKRVVGVPGDTVAMRDGQLFINGQPVQRTDRPGPCDYWDRDQDNGTWRQQHCRAYVEELGEHRHDAIFTTDDSRPRNFPPIKVEPDHVFVMGDNRDNSSDSRVWGQVPYRNIKGRAMFIWWAWSQDGPTPARFFTWIH